MPRVVAYSSNQLTIAVLQGVAGCYSAVHEAAQQLAAHRSLQVDVTSGREQVRLRLSSNVDLANKLQVAKAR